MKWKSRPAPPSVLTGMFDYSARTPLAEKKAPRPSLSELPWRKHIVDTVQTGFSKEFLDDLLRVVRAVTSNKPASIYSPNGDWKIDPIHWKEREGSCRWDREELDAHKIIVVDVLGNQNEKGHLHRLYHANRNDEEIYRHFRNAIKWHVGQFAKKRGARCLSLHQRIKSVLRKANTFHDFDQIGWGLSAWKGMSWRQLPEDVLEAKIDASEVPCPSSFRRKGRTLPTRGEAKQFLEQFLQRVGYPLSLERLRTAVEIHFDIFDSSPVPMPERVNGESGILEQVDFPASCPSPEALIEMHDQIRNFVVETTDEEVPYLDELFLKGKKGCELARPGSKRSTVSNHKLRIEARLRRLPLRVELLPYVEAMFEEEILKRRNQNGSANITSDTKARSEADRQIANKPSKEGESDRKVAVLDRAHTRRSRTALGARRSKRERY